MKNEFNGNFETEIFQSFAIWFRVWLFSLFYYSCVYFDSATIIRITIMCSQRWCPSHRIVFALGSQFIQIRSNGCLHAITNIYTRKRPNRTHKIPKFIEQYESKWHVSICNLIRFLCVHCIYQWSLCFFVFDALWIDFFLLSVPMLTAMTQQLEKHQ